MLTLGSGVWGFTYDSMVGEFVLSHPDIRIPEEGKIYAFNEGNYQARLAHISMCFMIRSSCFAFSTIFCCAQGCTSFLHEKSTRHCG